MPLPVEQFSVAYHMRRASIELGVGRLCPVALSTRNMQSYRSELVLPIAPEGLESFCTAVTTLETVELTEMMGQK